MIDLRKALDLAERIRAELLPFCERCEIAGSIRRARPFVNDIDLVVLPRDAAALRRRVMQRTEPISDGPEILRCRLANGIPLELFFTHAAQQDLLHTTPSNFTSVHVCRTGSKEHNIYIASRARELGLKWETMRGLVVMEESPGRPLGALLKTESEAEFFGQLGLDFIPPATRERS